MHAGLQTHSVTVAPPCSSHGASILNFSSSWAFLPPASHSYIIQPFYSLLVPSLDFLSSLVSLSPPSPPLFSLLLAHLLSCPSSVCYFLSPPSLPDASNYFPSYLQDKPPQPYFRVVISSLYTKHGFPKSTLALETQVKTIHYF